MSKAARAVRNPAPTPRLKKSAEFVDYECDSSSAIGLPMALRKLDVRPTAAPPGHGGAPASAQGTTSLRRRCVPDSGGLRGRAAMA